MCLCLIMMCLLILDVFCLLYGWYTIIGFILSPHVPDLDLDLDPDPDPDLDLDPDSLPAPVPVPVPTHEEIYRMSREAHLREQFGASLRDLDSSSECPACLVPWHSMPDSLNHANRISMVGTKCCGHTACYRCYMKWTTIMDDDVTIGCFICR